MWNAGAGVAVCGDGVLLVSPPFVAVSRSFKGAAYVVSPFFAFASRFAFVVCFLIAHALASARVST